jgi:hypothetical protein
VETLALFRIGDVELGAAHHRLVRPVALVQVEAAGEGKAKMALCRIEAASAVVVPPAISCE